jgi:hypothetical protein
MDGAQRKGSSSLVIPLGVAIAVVVASIASVALSGSRDEPCGAGEARSVQGFTYGATTGTDQVDAAESARDVALVALTWTRGTPVSAASRNALEAEVTPEALESLTDTISEAKYPDDGGATLLIDESAAPDGRRHPSIVVGQAANGTYVLESLSCCVEIEPN